MPETKAKDSLDETLKKLTRRAQLTSALVAAVVVLIAAIVGGYYHIRGIIDQAAVERAENRARTELTRDQAKAAAGDLATDVETLSAQVQQTQEDLAALREYISGLTLPKGQGQSRPPLLTPTVRVKPTASAAPPAATQEPVLPAPPPPEVTLPEPIDLKSQKMNDRFKD